MLSQSRCTELRACAPKGYLGEVDAGGVIAVHVAAASMQQVTSQSVMSMAKDGICDMTPTTSCSWYHITDMISETPCGLKVPYKVVVDLQVRATQFFVTMTGQAAEPGYVTRNPWPRAWI